MIHRRLALLLCLGLLASCATTQKSASTGLGKIVKEEVNGDRLKRAQQLYEMGQIDAAIASLNAMIHGTKMTPAVRQAYRLLIDYLLQAQRPSEAQSLASFFLRHNSHSQEARDIVALFGKQPPVAKDVKTIPPTPKPPQEVLPAHPQEELPVPTPEVPKPDEALPIAPDANELPRNIGVILPLSGHFEPFGKRALAAVELALGSPLTYAGTPLTIITPAGETIVIVDSQGNSEGGARAAKTLIADHHVALLIGDIVNDATVGAAKAAADLNVPMLALSRHPSITSLGDRVFAFSISYHSEISALLDFSTGKGLSRYAIFYPRHDFGIEMARMFNEEVIKRGLHLQGLESYDPHETTFTNPIKKLVGMYYVEARPELRACEQQKKISGSKAPKSCKGSLKPEIDFDALFVPDFYLKIPLILPAFVSADILISDDNKSKRAYGLANNIENPTPVQLLGPSSWSDESLEKKIAPYAGGAYYLDLVSPQSKEYQEFSKAFERFNLGPPKALDLFTHDALVLAMKLAHKPLEGKTMQDSIFLQLSSLEDTLPYIGKVSFQKNRELTAPLYSSVVGALTPVAP